MAVINITNQNYQEEVLKADKTVLMDFWASWCGPCQMLSPVVDAFAQKHDDVKVGTAGLTAGLYGVRAGKTVKVLEQKNYGGQIINSKEIVNYPGISKISGYEFATSLYRQATDAGVDFALGKVKSIRDLGKVKEVVAEIQGEEKVYEAKAVILAAGAKNRELGLPDEKKLTGAGVSYCATCDGMFFRDRNVAVAGGGSTALEDALFLSNYCKEVALIHRRDTFRGEQKMVEELQKKDNVTFFCKTPGIFAAGDCRAKKVRQLATAASDGAVAALAACDYIGI